MFQNIVKKRYQIDHNLPATTFQFEIFEVKKIIIYRDYCRLTADYAILTYLNSIFIKLRSIIFVNLKTFFFNNKIQYI